ncbi:hemolymph lipopolysaccharide-binding protein-like [Periplaneta americana]|uniref:hemolymph lipopolysaccharide-binding protein-like n=1 Tax=Periplaneta americana TaxID=6978 RepID=UPI0037E90379
MLLLLLLLGSATPAPPGYDLFPGLGHYKLHNVLRTWREAERMCAEDGGHLAVINSMSEAVVLTRLFGRVPSVPGADAETNDVALVGFHDLYVEDEYLTVFGNYLNSTGFTLWHEGNPDNRLGVEDCGGVHRTSGKLVDLSCETIFPFFCEIRI